MSDHSCEFANELMAASWTGELGVAAEAELRDHLEHCSACAAECEALGSLWQTLGDLPEPKPGIALHARWQRTLASFAPTSAPRSSWRNLWPANPVWQLAIAAGALAVGLAGGAFLERVRADCDEIARLRQEVSGTQALAALSMLREQSAVERLRGIDYSERMAGLEPRVVAALIDTVNRDPNVNVRLAAVNALAKVEGDSQVRDSLRQSLAHQDSPMVQAALIDYLLDAPERNSVEALRQLAARPDLNPAVHDRAVYAATQLSK